MLKLCVLVLLLLGCEKKSAPPAAPSGSAAPADAAAPAPPRDAAPPALTWRGDHCDDDKQCGWDDPCVAKRCGNNAPPGVGCDKSAAKPGECRCNERMCTLRPADPAYGASAAGCKTDDECAVDVGTGTCHLGGTTLIGPITSEGPVCLCDKASTTCRLAWSGPVACRSWKDCSWVQTPRLRAVPSSQVRRPVNRPVRACKDGEVDAVCTPEHTCKIVGWSC